MNLLNNKIKITDKIMGSGKTSEIFNKLNEEIKSRPETKYIFVVVTKDEIKRVLKNCKGFAEPTESLGKGSKTKAFKTLLETNNNHIVTTHSLFEKLIKEDAPLFEGYNLIIDETPEMVCIRKEKQADVEEFIENGTIIVDDLTQAVSWSEHKDSYDGVLVELKERIQAGSITYVKKNSKKDTGALVWCYPPEIFRAFDSVEVLTYLFEGSLLKAYLEYNGFRFDRNINRKESERIEYFKSLISIYYGKYNNIGNPYFSLSKNWFIKNVENDEFRELKNNTINFFRTYSGKDINKNAFSVFTQFGTKMKGKKYSKGFISINERATNEHSHKTTIAYLVNRFYNKKLITFFAQKNITISENELALSELIQFVFRFAIRNNEPIFLYIPSKRMRNLFVDWLSQSEDNVRRYRNRWIVNEINRLFDLKEKVVDVAF